MTIQELTREQVGQIWTIDRREVINNVYYLEDGNRVLKPEHYDMQGWPPGEPEAYAPILYDCFDRGGTFYGAFEESRLVGVAVLESKFIGKRRDQLQLTFLHVSHSHRKTGLGCRLFEKAVEKARAKRARRLYISATPSENTVNFYLHLGCVIAEEVDPELFALEPEDIHLEYDLRDTTSNDERVRT
jgi:predicted N-acetyltransferase YhbS